MEASYICEMYSSSEQPRQTFFLVFIHLEILSSNYTHFYIPHLLEKYCISVYQILLLVKLCYMKSRRVCSPFSRCNIKRLRNFYQIHSNLPNISFSICCKYYKQPLGKQNYTTVRNMLCGCDNRGLFGPINISHIIKFLSLLTSLDVKRSQLNDPDLQCVLLQVFKSYGLQPNSFSMVTSLLHLVNVQCSSGII